MGIGAEETGDALRAGVEDKGRSKDGGVVGELNQLGSLV